MINLDLYLVLFKGKAVQCQVKGTDKNNVKQVTLFTKEQGELVRVKVLLSRVVTSHFGTWLILEY